MPNDDTAPTKQLLYLSTLGLIGKSISIVLAALISRQFGPWGIGSFNITISLLAFFGMLGRFGLGTSFIFYASKPFAETDLTFVFQLYTRCLKIIFILGAIISTFFFLFTDPLTQLFFKHPNEKKIIKLIAWIFLANLLHLFNYCVLKALNAVYSAFLLETLLIPLATLCLCLTHLQVQQTLDFYTLLLYFTGSITLLALLSTILIVKKIQSKIPAKTLMPKQLIPRSFRHMLIDLLSYLGFVSSSLLWVLYLDNHAIGLIGACSTIFGFITIFISSMNCISYRQYAESFNAKKYQTLYKQVKKNSFLLRAFLLPISTLIFLFPEITLSLFGPEFLQAKVCLQFFCAALFVLIWNSQFSSLLLMTGHEKDMLHITLWTSLLSIFLNLTIIKIGTVEIATLIFCAGIIIHSIWSMLLAHKRLNLDSYNDLNFT